MFNGKPKPTTQQWLCIGAGVVLGYVLGFMVLSGGAIGGGVMGLCAFVGAIPYKKAIDGMK